MQIDLVLILPRDRFQSRLDFMNAPIYIQALALRSSASWLQHCILFIEPPYTHILPCAALASRPIAWFGLRNAPHRNSAGTPLAAASSCITAFLATFCRRENASHWNSLTSIIIVNEFQLNTAIACCRAPQTLRLVTVAYQLMLKQQISADTIFKKKMIILSSKSRKCRLLQ